MQKKKQGKIVALILTHACNLNCVYCFEKHKSNKMMSLDTAKEIIRYEIEKCKQSADIDYLKFDLFGGEPLLNFTLLQELVEWAVDKNFSVEHYFSVTTNGTLLTEDKQEWFIRHKDKIEVILSIDGQKDTQLKNRGCHEELLPVNFVAHNWPEQYLKMTVSDYSLPTFGTEMISMLEQGYNVSCALAVGNPWKSGDAEIYKRELQKIADYYLTHPNKEPAPIFYRLYAELLEPHIGNLPLKNCGCGTTMAAYDVDGRSYPCHMFVPLVHGNEIWEDLQQIDFKDYVSLIDKECLTCGLLKICRTCYGFNFNVRNDITKRDKTACEMFLAEAQVVSTFLIKYLMQRKEELSPEQLLMLQGALKCYELYHDYKFVRQ